MYPPQSALRLVGILNQLLVNPMNKAIFSAFKGSVEVARRQVA